jgi:hypothetical protein
VTADVIISRKDIVVGRCLIDDARLQKDYEHADLLKIFMTLHVMNIHHR